MSELVVSHNTADGFAIGIVKTVGYRTGADVFEVVRLNGDSRYIVLDRADTEGWARKLANTAWLRDMGRDPAPMILMSNG